MLNSPLRHLMKYSLMLRKESCGLMKAWRTFIFLKSFQSSLWADETSSPVTNWQTEWVWTFLKSFRLFVLGFFWQRRSSRSAWVSLASLRSEFILPDSIIQLNCFPFLMYSFKKRLFSHMSVPRWCFCSQPLVFNLSQSWIVNHLGIKSVFKHGWSWTLRV